jgi:pectin methylesterase-like acyl-CoA thioesterase
MALVDATLVAGILAGLQAQFPPPTGCSTAQKAQLATAQSNLATALAAPIDTQTKTAVVTVASLTAIVATGAGAPGTVTGTGTGTLS